MFFTTAQAVSVSHTWDFNSTCYANGACNDTFDPVGNVRTAPSDNGLSVDVRAFAFAGSGGTGPAVAAWLAQYLNLDGGLGVSSSSGDSHTIDNAGDTDFVVFEFNQQVNVTGYYMTFIGFDADTTWYVGDLAPGFNFVGLTLADMENTLGLTKGTNSWSPSDSSPSETIVTDVVGNYFILAARVEQDNDKFKLRTITATQQVPDALPEPSTLVLLASGLTVLGFVARRRMKKARVEDVSGGHEPV
jgi:hypothetical protein